MTSFVSFETPIGGCGVAWGPRGIVRIWLPGRLPDAAATAPPAPVCAAIDGMIAVLSGDRRDLREVELDLSAVPEQRRRIYAIARSVPPGETITYGELARRLDAPGAARVVGQAMGANPCPIVIPCHRVLAAGGRIGGFSADGGVATKRRMLAIEGGLAQLTLAT